MPSGDDGPSCSLLAGHGSPCGRSTHSSHPPAFSSYSLTSSSPTLLLSLGHSQRNLPSLVTRGLVRKHS